MELRDVLDIGTPGGTLDLAVEREHERHSVFGHGVGGIGGDTYDGDTCTLCSSDIDVVVARTAQGDQTHPVVLEVLDELCVHLVIDEDADDLDSLSEADIV